MLHPHVPEDLKHFARHLLAVFLGLLMALALEQWREHAHETRVAAEYMTRIDHELRQNGDMVRKRVIWMKDAERSADTLVSDLERMIAARRAKRPAAPPSRPPFIRAEFSFSTSAWDAAKAAGVVRQIEPTRVYLLSTIYSGMQRITQIQDREVTTGPGVVGASLYDEDWSKLDTASLEDLLGYARFERGCTRNRLRIAREFQKDLNEIIGP